MLKHKLIIIKKQKTKIANKKIFKSKKIKQNN